MMLWGVTLLVIIFLVAAVSLQNPRTHYPEVIIQASDTVQVTMLLQSHSSDTQCMTATRTVVSAMKNSCPDCAVIQARCLDSLNPRQRMLLAGQTVDVPVMRIARGVLTFESADSSIAAQTCLDSARQSGGIAQCITPNAAGLALALANASHTQMEFSPSSASLVKLTLFAALVSCLVCGFIIWSERWHGRFSHDAVQSGPQKFHAVAVPRIGGIAIACSLAATLVGLDAADLLATDTVHGFALLALSALPAFGGGLAEDLTKKVGVLARLLLTMAAGALASIMIGATLTRLDVPGLDNLLQYWPLFAIVFTAFAVGGVANAINIIDGYHGLAAGYSIIVLAALAWVSIQVGDQVVLLASLTMMGAMTGFLVWNWPSGKIFLGDGGAYLLGFWLAELGVLLVVRNPEVSPWFPLAIMAYPIWETLFSMYRRKIVHNHNAGHPDALHLHQLVYQRLVRVAVGSRTSIDITRRNSRVAIYCWVGTAPFISLACAIWHSTPWMLGLSALFVYDYIWLYQRLTRWRAPRFLIWRNFIFKNRL